MLRLLRLIVVLPLLLGATFVATIATAFNGYCGDSGTDGCYFHIDLQVVLLAVAFAVIAGLTYAAVAGLPKRSKLPVLSWATVAASCAAVAVLQIEDTRRRVDHWHAVHGGSVDDTLMWLAVLITVLAPVAAGPAALRHRPGALRVTGIACGVVCANWLLVVSYASWLYRETI
jgi:hypothetical protein